jgi:thiaminase/transcriptional activator TenA
MLSDSVHPSRSERYRAGSPWADAVDHPFVHALTGGTLAPERFGRYLIQDYAYVADLVDALGYLIAKAPSADAKRRFGSFLLAVLDGEDHFFRETFALLGIPETAWRQPPLAPVTVGIGQTLRAAAGQGSYAEGLAAFLAGEWVYREWATPVKEHPPAYGPYRAWIRLHSDADFSAFVDWLRAELDGLVLSPTEEARAQAAFIRMVRWESLFWNVADETW